VPETTPRKFRIPDDLWAALQERAEVEHTTVTAIVVRAAIRELKRANREDRER
jgi:predicted transcriptional regulator